MKRLLLFVAIVPLLYGCPGSAPPVPRDHFYRLLVSGPAHSSAVAPFPGVMMVQMLQADGLLSERPVLYSATGASYEVQQYDYHYWADAPPRMLQDQMVGYLRRSGIADSVVTPEMRIQPDYLVSGKVKRLENLLGGGPPRVFVEIELSLVRAADNSLILDDDFSEQEPVDVVGVAGSVTALNKATGRIFDRFLQRALAGGARIARNPPPSSRQH